ncbi:uncharacterized protein (DUF934 family) [Sphaerotilus hippei]|uniref:Uncharacterized protein (DUF934 family) n=1 Tax=Sphaerotilus hippei TaxID=744406 RepID=A0A318H4H8_9BURK|nr:DUF934 domain-containing protein [Sphaerotilus hippei]PXW98722.1 uncharacterized protein (DUF934 family) [Sphaerotilus hippei]
MKFIDTHHDLWHTVGGEDGPSPHPIARDHQLLTLEQWHAVRDTWPAGLATGLLLSNTADVELLEADLPRLALIVLHFPKWVDGRAYSQAHLLRSRYRFQGEVRATGDVLVDMLPLLKRTGFDAVAMRHDQNREAAERALGFFGGHYQGDVAVSKPLFARPATEAWVDQGALSQGAAI